jgi:uncharacterized membrane protein (UPF0127 family)
MQRTIGGTLALVIGLLAACGHEEAPPVAASAEPAPTSSTASPAVTASAAPAATVAAVADTAAPPPPSTGTAARCLRPLATVAPPLPPKAAACPHDTYKQIPPLGHGRVHVDGAPGTTVKVEIARKPAATERGLMFRTEMAEDAGMFFELGDRTEHQFWMHNTCIPLDLLFVDTDGTIVGVVEAAGTLDDTPLTVGCFSDRVLEVNAGWTRRHGVTPGQKLVLVTEPASK